MPIATFDYNQLINGNKDARLGKLIGKLSAVVSEKSIASDKEFSVIPYLYREEKSDSFSENIIIEDKLNTMTPVIDGDKSKKDQTNQIGQKTISHVPYGLSTVFTRQFLDDAHGSLKPQLRTKAEEIPSAYHETREEVAQLCYIQAQNKSAVYAGAKIDLTTYDGEPLFSSKHIFGSREGGHAYGKQSNNFYVVNAAPTSADIALYLEYLNSYIHQMKTNNGKPQGFKADTVAVPSNVENTKLRSLVRQAVGSDFYPGTANNDINIQAGQWNYVPMSTWGSDKMELMVISGKAKDLGMKSMFYNRVSLEISAYIENGTKNLIYDSYARFGIGHADYKHATRLTIFASEPTELEKANMTLLF